MNEYLQIDRSTGPAQRYASDPTPSARRRAGVVFLLFLLMVLSLLQAGCDVFLETVPKGKNGAVSVMTRNVYVGDDIGTVLNPGATPLPVAVAQFYGRVQATDFTERSKAIADEIEAASPDLIGLQEVALYRIQSPSDFDPLDPAQNATAIAQDFLAILMNELSSRGLNYRVVSELENADIELPATTDGVSFFDLRLTDRDVILAREQTRIIHEEARHFATNVELPFTDSDGNALELLRGYGIVKAKVRGSSFTFVNTHLETAAGAMVQVAQANELLDELANVEGPVVLLGDFNTAAPGAASTDLDTDTYGIISNAYADAWSEVNPGQTGYTCCQAADLRNDVSELAWRIDHIWHGEGVDAVMAERLGEEVSDRTPSGLWPSDHAGVAALLRIKRN